MGNTLFNITAEFERLYELATQDEDMNQEAFEGTLEALIGELEVKAGGYCNVIKQLEMEADRAKNMSLVWEQKQKVRENSIKRMKEALKDAMVRTEQKQIDAGDYVIKLQKNGGKQPLIIDGDVPDNYQKIIYETDKEKIRKDLEAGKELPFAYLEERGQHVVIK